MPDCSQSQFECEAHFPRQAVAEFSGERLTTEGGALLLRAVDRKIGLRRCVARCFSVMRRSASRSSAVVRAAGLATN